MAHHQFFDDTNAMLAFDQLISPHLSLTDLSNSILGNEPAYIRHPESFATACYNIDLPKDLGSSFDVPIFFLTGSHDRQTSVDLSDKWFSEIEAPHKELIHFEESSHVVINEEPGRFLLALVNRILPFSQVEAK